MSIDVQHNNLKSIQMHLPSTHGTLNSTCHLLQFKCHTMKVGTTPNIKPDCLWMKSLPREYTWGR
ncbi:hypothetical protein CY34DRAFT_814285 [Suillus luteus UH-Slu-Lm8-n1]|uniref:Uncharacterized protein n=1 Tax=Suillus luteus UH-Slu-Lm8-n1 TaxID=930992 RepID=A0A0D0ADZ8_9AGAM|nr:hypothetical protein CY34DRAFT_814285 [Suillus luteus UH-Slu-Lm8-n1]